MKELHGQRVVLLNSGGKDSLAVAILLRREKCDVYSLHVDVGSSEATLAAAQKIADRYCNDHSVLELRNNRYDYRVRAGFHEQRPVLPMLGAMHACLVGARFVTSGHTINGQIAKELDAHFPGAANAYLKATEKPAFRETPQVVLPLLKLSKEEIFDIVEREPMWRELSTCPKDPPCGVCPKCVKKAQFIAIGLRRKNDKRK